MMGSLQLSNQCLVGRNAQRTRPHASTFHPFNRLLTPSLASPAAAAVLPSCWLHRRSRAATILHTASAEAIATVADAKAPQSSQPLNWYKQWYPLAIVHDLDPKRPHAAQLLGKQLVLWCDGQGVWHAQEDRCPHRLAPLSEGRLEPSTGNLMCSYHGWQFDGSGACTSIPQIGDPKVAATAARSARACVATYPSKVEQGLLWVWAEAGPGAVAESASSSAATIPELDDPSWRARTGWFMRDVPLSYDTVVENVMDPCHANFTHHGVQGRRENEKGTVITPMGLPSQAGFACSIDSRVFKVKFGYQSPGLLRYDFNSGVASSMCVYLVPSGPGTTRMLTRFLSSKAPRDANAPARPKGPLLQGLATLMFFKVMAFVESVPVLEHALRNQVLDGDNYILHLQERRVLAEGAASWRSSFYMPGKSDTGVGAWRRWLEGFGRDLPVLPRQPADLGPALSRVQVLDRYSQHTQHCKTCQTALGRIEAALPAVWALGAGLLLAAALLAARGAPPLSWAVAGSVAGAALAGLLHRLLAGWRQLFYYKDYVHAEIN